MITERTLKKWRGEALKFREKHAEDRVAYQIELCERILKLTQELLDQHLLRKVVR